MGHISDEYSNARLDDNIGFAAMRGVVRGIRRKVEAEKIYRAQPPYHRNLRRIIIDVTHYCNLNCVSCNRSCGLDQANVKENMSIEQIEKFVEESIDQKHYWETIVLEGGEPTIHPKILKIIDLIVEYKRNHSPSTAVVLATNGYARGADKIIAKLPADVIVNNSAKETVEQHHHCNFNLAPIDVMPNASETCRNGCILPSIYGLGLNRYGYYPHPVCGGIDRIMGLDIGLKSLPEDESAMADMYGQLCQYCGHFFDSNDCSINDNIDKDAMSPSWKKAYASYWESKPQLTLYGGES